MKRWWHSPKNCSVKILRSVCGSHNNDRAVWISDKAIPQWHKLCLHHGSCLMIMWVAISQEWICKIYLIYGITASFESVAKFKYLGTTLTYQYRVHDEIRSRLNCRNACYLSVWNLLSSHLLSKNIKITIYWNVIAYCFRCVKRGLSHQGKI